MMNLGEIFEMPVREMGSLIQESKVSDRVTEHSSHRIHSQRPRNDTHITLIGEVKY